MTLDEIKKLPPLSEKRKKEMDVENEKIYDTPVLENIISGTLCLQTIFINGFTNDFIYAIFISLTVIFVLCYSHKTIIIQ